MKNDAPEQNEPSTSQKVSNHKYWKAGAMFAAGLVGGSIFPVALPAFCGLGVFFAVAGEGSHGKESGLVDGMKGVFKELTDAKTDFPITSGAFYAGIAIGGGLLGFAALLATLTAGAALGVSANMSFNQGGILSRLKERTKPVEFSDPEPVSSKPKSGV